MMRHPTSGDEPYASPAKRIFIFIETGKNLLFSAILVGQGSENESGSEPTVGIAVQAFIFVANGAILSTYVNPVERDTRRAVA